LEKISNYFDELYNINSNYIVPDLSHAKTPILLFF